uniref:Histidine-rich glycoprotein n=1 Tax=Cavia porcellus TaxID=10141 RepID=H0W2U2_CAVPO
MGDHSRGWLSTMSLLTAALFVTTLRYSWALSRTDCSAVEPEAEKAVDLINKGRWNGYLFQLLRVADAHLDTMGPATVYYLALDVRESDCWVLPRKNQELKPSLLQVIGQCKVIAKRYSKESQDFKVKDFNCTTSSVSSALSNTKDSPVLFDFFEDTEPYRPQAEKALDKYKKENEAFASFRVDQVARVIVAKGGERTNYYVDFSVRNCSAYQFHRSPNVFGFCRADLSYATEPSELETPKDLLVDCEVFNFEDHKNISDLPHHGGHHHHFGPHGPPPHGHPPHGHPPHGPPPHGHHPHGPPPHGHHPHEHPPHGPPPHGHHPHGPPPHGHHPHGHPPHGPPPHRHHPHGHGFHDFGPCDPPQDYQGPKDHQHHGHDHGEKEPGKGHFRFHRRKSGHIVRLPPLKVGEVLPLPEANFPRFLLPFHNYSIPPEFQPFPQSTLPSASCPGKFKSELPTQLEDFFAYKSSK